jgi:hypothetical protein
LDPKRVPTRKPGINDHLMVRRGIILVASKGSNRNRREENKIADATELRKIGTF